MKGTTQMTNTTKEVKANAKAAKQANAKHSKSFYFAVVQAIAITIVIALAVGFMAGKHYANHQSEAIYNQAKAISSSLK